jgi:hypothetical protein
MRHHEVLGSSCGWLATAHYDQIYLVNPATGEQHALPEITTMGVFVPQPHGDFTFVVSMESFLTARFGDGPPFGDNCWGPEERWKSMFDICEMPMRFYRKVVLAIGRRPGSHTAMLILNRDFGAPAFATADDGAVWRLALSPDGVEDAIQHPPRRSVPLRLVLRRRGGLGSRRGVRCVHGHDHRAKAGNSRHRRRRRKIITAQVPGSGAGREADGGGQARPGRDKG